MNKYERRVIRVTYEIGQEMVAIVAYALTATQPRFVAEPCSALRSLAVVMLQQPTKARLAADVGQGRNGDAALYKQGWKGWNTAGGCGSTRWSQCESVATKEARGK